MVFGTLHSAASLSLGCYWESGIIPRTSKNAYFIFNAALPLALLTKQLFHYQTYEDSRQRPHTVATPPGVAYHPLTGPFFFSLLVPMALLNLSWVSGGLVAI